MSTASFDYDPPPQIIAEIYATRRLFKWQWRFRFIGLNGEKIGDDYTQPGDARRAVNLIVKPQAEVTLRIRRRDGSVEEIGRIR